MFKLYQRKSTIEVRDLLPDETSEVLLLKNISVSATDNSLSDYDFSFGKVARNPKNIQDQWYINYDYFINNYEPLE
jgi:hypothetical protein